MASKSAWKSRLTQAVAADADIISSVSSVKAGVLVLAGTWLGSVISGGFLGEVGGASPGAGASHAVSKPTEAASTSETSFKETPREFY